MDEFNHIGYADESRWSGGRYRSIALITAERPTAERVSGEVARVLAESNLSGSKPEFAWKNLRTDKTLAVANAITRITVAAAYSEPFRVDVITWDNQDSRNAVARRDDLANFEHMYYHLIIGTIERKWPRASWLIRPDDRTDTDWRELEQCLQFPSRKSRLSQSLALDKRLQSVSIPLRIKAVTSTHPLIQVADLFAGIASFSWEKRKAYAAWKSRRIEQPDMFLNVFQEELQLTTHGGEYKSQTLHNFEKIYLQRLRGRDKKEFEKRPGGLVTRDPSTPINFWFYAPQGSYDKAPRKAGIIGSQQTSGRANPPNRK